MSSPAQAQEEGVMATHQHSHPQKQDKDVDGSHQHGTHNGKSVNDPVGIAMGTATDVAVESAGVALLKGDLQGIVRAQQLSRATKKNIRQNLFFAFI